MCISYDWFFNTNLGVKRKVSRTFNLRSGYWNEENVRKKIKRAKNKK